jgi:hypothetical protein
VPSTTSAPRRDNTPGTARTRDSRSMHSWSIGSPLDLTQQLLRRRSRWGEAARLARLA